MEYISDRHISPANQKLMRYEDLKIHIAEVEWCQKHTHTKSLPPVLFPENLWENETLQLKPGDRQRGSTKNNIDTLTFDVCLFPASSSVSPWSPTTSFSRTSPGFPDSPGPYPQEIFFRGTWRLIEMAKRVLSKLQLTQHLLEMKWSPHAGSHFSQTFHGIATLDYQLMDLDV